MTLILNILVLPRIVPFTFGESPIFAGQSAQVTCFVLEGDTPLDISWTFNDSTSFKHLGISTAKVGLKTSVLLIEAAGSQHRGQYTCRVENPAGVVNFTTRLEINGNSFI